MQQMSQHLPEQTAQQTPQQTTGQQHPLSLYLKIWALLFVLSTCSYLVDYFDFQGLLRWSLIVTFMLLKAGLILSIFMHMTNGGRVLGVTALGDNIPDAISIAYNAVNHIDCESLYFRTDIGKKALKYI